MTPAGWTAKARPSSAALPFLTFTLARPVAHKDKQKPLIVPAPKRRSIIALHAKRRRAGPFKDKRDRSCPTCRDTGVVELRVAPGVNRKFACYDCQHD